MIRQNEEELIEIKRKDYNKMAECISDCNVEIDRLKIDLKLYKELYAEEKKTVENLKTIIKNHLVNNKDKLNEIKGYLNNE